MAEANKNPEEERRVNSARHTHELCLSNILTGYTCSGCKEEGIQTGYRCTGSCGNSFILHQHCVELPDSYDHPFLRWHLQFRDKTTFNHQCNFCQKALGGYVFESKNPHRRLHPFRLHPLCMMLPHKHSFKVHASHPLELLANDTQTDHRCKSCDGRFKGGWRYKCPEGCQCSIDLSCAKKEIYEVPRYDSGGGSSGTTIPSFLSTTATRYATTHTRDGTTLIDGVIATAGGTVEAVVLGGCFTDQFTPENDENGDDRNEETEPENDENDNDINKETEPENDDSFS